MVDCSVLNISVTDLLRYLRYKKTPIFCSEHVGILARNILEINSQSTEIGKAQWFNITAADSVDFVFSDYTG